jgi:hypothetical protein
MKLHVIREGVEPHLVMINDINDILNVRYETGGTEYGALRYAAVDWVVSDASPD